MIETLARKRTHLGALAVLAALAVALFAATISSQTTGPRITSTTDTDFVISDGDSITVSVTDGTGYTFQPVFGFVLSGTVADGPAIYTHQAGAPEGDFTIRATHATAATLEKTLTVGDKGDAVATAEIVAAEIDTDANTHAVDATTDDNRGTAKLEANAGGAIRLTLNVKNGLDKAANNTEISSIVIVALGGIVGAGDTAAAGAAANDTLRVAAADAVNEYDFGVAGVTDRTYMVDVYAIVTGSDNTSATSETITLTFATPGDAATLILPDPQTIGPVTTASPATLPDVANDTILLAVTAEDEDGVTTTTGLATVATSITDEDGEGVEGVTAEYAVDTDLDGDTNTPGEPGITVVFPVDVEAGTYTVSADLGATVGDDAATTTITVSGAPTNVELEVDTSNGTGLGARVSVTATVTDANDNLVAPEALAFTVGNGSPATFVGVDPTTEDGVGSRDAVITGSGTVTIIVTTSNGVSGVDVIVASEAPVEAPPEPEPTPDPMLDSIALSAVGEGVSAGDIVTVIATLTDDNGDPMADGTSVTFLHSGGGELFASQSMVLSSDGTAQVQYTVTDDIWVRAVSGIVQSETLRVMVTSADEAQAAADAEAARIAAEEAAAAEAAAEEAARQAAEEAAAAEAAEEEAARQAAEEAAEAEAAAQAAAEAEAARLAEIEAAVQAALDAQAAADEAARQAAEEAARQAAEEAAAQAAAEAEAAAEAAAAEAEAAAAAAAAEVARIAAEVEAEIERLTGMSGFTSWLAEGSTTASTLFDALSSDGATALHVWNGSTWVRYSVVDGAMVPGSVDFTIERGDVLFISN